MMIRKLGKTDVDIFKPIRLESLRCAPKSYASHAHDWEDLSQQDWLLRMSDCTVFVAMKGTEPVGIMALMPNRPSKMAHRATIIMVYVRKSERGSGLAYALLAAVTKHACKNGISQLELAVSAENPAAARFYRKAGFADIGVMPAGLRHNGRDIDEIMMVRRIAD